MDSYFDFVHVWYCPGMFLFFHREKNFCFHTFFISSLFVSHVRTMYGTAYFIIIIFLFLLPFAFFFLYMDSYFDFVHIWYCPGIFLYFHREKNFCFHTFYISILFVSHVHMMYGATNFTIIVFFIFVTFCPFFSLY